MLVMGIFDPIVLLKLIFSPVLARSDELDVDSFLWSFMGLSGADPTLSVSAASRSSTVAASVGNRL